MNTEHSEQFEAVLFLSLLVPPSRQDYLNGLLYLLVFLSVGEYVFVNGLCDKVFELGFFVDDTEALMFKMDLYGGDSE